MENTIDYVACDLKLAVFCFHCIRFSGNSS